MFDSQRMEGFLWCSVVVTVYFLFFKDEIKRMTKMFLKIFELNISQDPLLKDI